MEEILHHQGWWRNPIIYRGFNGISGGCLGFLNHQPKMEPKMPPLERGKTHNPTHQLWSSMEVIGSMESWSLSWLISPSIYNNTTYLFIKGFKLINPLIYKYHHGHSRTFHSTILYLSRWTLRVLPVSWIRPSTFSRLKNCTFSERNSTDIETWSAESPRKPTSRTRWRDLHHCNAKKKDWEDVYGVELYDFKVIYVIWFELPFK